LAWQVNPALQELPLQHGWAAAPQAGLVQWLVPSQVPAEHGVAVVQQTSPRPPQEIAQTLFWQVAVPVHAVPVVQQGWPTAPQGAVQTLLEQVAAPVHGAPLLQHGWPTPPQAVQLLAWQMNPALHELPLQHG